MIFFSIFFLILSYSIVVVVVVVVVVFTLLFQHLSIPFFIDICNIFLEIEHIYFFAVFSFVTS